MKMKLTAAWRAVPLLVRAPIVAFLVLNIGTTVTVLPLVANLRFLPTVPWALPATLVLVALFWYYFSGGGPPAATRPLRQDVTRLKSLPPAIWRAVLLPILLSLVTVTSLRLALPSVLPIDSPTIGVDLSSYGVATVVGLLLSLAISAGVVEEVAFRGYLQEPLERRYGIVPALLFTGFAFWLAHVPKVTFTHLPFHLVASVLLGFIAYRTNSLLPAMIGHAAGDALLLPAYVFRRPAFVWSALSARPVWERDHTLATLPQRLRAIGQAISPTAMSHGGAPQRFAVIFWVFILSVGLTAIAFRRLARVTSENAG